MTTLDPTSLRVAADAYEKKAERLLAASDIEKANRCLDIAISLRLEANAAEDAQRRKESH